MMDVHEETLMNKKLREERGVAGFARRLLRIQRREEGMVAGSIALSFLLQSVIGMLGPVRDAMGIDEGWETLWKLLLYTLGVMAVVYPGIAWVFSRMPKRWALLSAMCGVLVSLIVFYVVGLALGAEGRVKLGYVFYVWQSVINLLLVSLFWSLMNDGYEAEQSRRLFPLVAVGATGGAIFGSWLTGSFSSDHGLIRQLIGGRTLEHFHFLLIAAGLLAGAVAGTLLMFPVLRENERRRNERDRDRKIDLATEPDTGNDQPRRDVWSGLKLLASSKLVMTIAAYLMLYAMTSNLLYYAQGKIIDETISDHAQQRATFANLTMYGNLLALFCQLFVTSRLVKWMGVGKTLMVTPVVTLIGLGWISKSPTLSGLWFAQVARKGLHYSVDRPPREALYGVLSVDAKYKAKNFVDTVVYRSGDLCGMLTWMAIVQWHIGMMWVVTPVILLWVAMALRAGNLYERAAISEIKMNGNQ